MMFGNVHFFSEPVLGLSVAVPVSASECLTLFQPQLFEFRSKPGFVIVITHPGAQSPEDEPLVIFGDIAVPTGLQNADPCTARGCLWPKNNGRVVVPYRISDQKLFYWFVIKFLFTALFQVLLFCWASWGGQIVSLSRQGCVFHQIVQHEVLHALGFDHEQTRSDRDQHVRILLENVIPGMEHNFRKINTRNLDTPYDYNSVMHYGRFAFSRDREPTIVPIPDENVAIGRATEMSANDILRVNRLYTCSMYLVSFRFFFFPFL
uniref:Metalloendopeptidase n=1 Tax=Maylandia zebra TaxID=106582 RepID=A0A3P9DV39_9CICH